MAGTFINAQNNICICCAYKAIEGSIMDYSLFPSGQVSAVNVKQVIIRTRGTSGCEENKDSNTFVVKKTLAGEYTEFKFQFNENGTIRNYIRYYRGVPDHIMEFAYRNQNRLVTSSSFSIDSAEKKIWPTPNNISDFYYTDKMKLAGEKERGYRGQIEKDDTATFWKYSYDDKNRIISQYSQTYSSWDKKAYRSNSVTLYSLTDYQSTTRDSGWIDSDKKDALQSTSTTTYDSFWRPLKTVRKTINPKVTETEVYKYNDSGKLVSYTKTTNPPRSFECPEDGNYTITFTYNRYGLPEHIKHCYKKLSCDMKFEYVYQ